MERDAKFHDTREGADMKALAAGKATPEQTARIEKSPYLNAEIRTTCVATLLNGGHADNALPQRATAISTAASCPVRHPRKLRIL